MSGFFYRLGQTLGPSVRKGRWLWSSATGSDAEAMEAERGVGEDLADATLRDLPLDEDPASQSLVGELAVQLSRCVKNPHRRFHVQVAGDGPPNAFALPGGFIFLTRSLIDLTEGNRDELAFVIGHEMGHVIRRHPMERIMTSTAIGAAVKALPSTRVIGGWIKSTAGQLLMGAYSQDRELEADALGLALADAAGFDTAAPSNLFRRLEEFTPTAELPLAEYFASHPPFETRIRALEKRLRR